MNDPQRFSAHLTSKILGLLGAASLTAPLVSCGHAANGTSSSSGAQGAGGAGATSTSTAADMLNIDGGGGAVSPMPPVQQCMDVAADKSCPTDFKTVGLTLEKLTENADGGCQGAGGWEASIVDSGPTRPVPTQCCYIVELRPCQQGGRPYFVGDRAQVAEARRGVAGTGWNERNGEGATVDGLTAAERGVLAAAWTADALMEHASVASFSRFSLALMAVGAPAELVELAHRAALDEIGHAQRCLALASAYAGEAITPGPFPVGGAVDVPTSLAALAASTVKEGCIGETVAAVIAAEQLARATDPAVRAALQQIADDEARHAELAWRTVAWALDIGGAEVRSAVEKAFCEAIASHDAASEAAEAHSPALEGHGRLDAAATSAIAARTMAAVVAPCAQALVRRAAPASVAVARPGENANQVAGA